MKNNPTVTIGIPAYNEAANIRRLLSGLHSQVLDNIILERIIVISDGSTDETAAEAGSAAIDYLTVINGRQRRGLAARENQLIGLCQSDVLVILNADILINDKFFISRITGPILSGQADLTSCQYTCLPPEGPVAKALSVNLLIKNYAFGKFRNGRNIYTCHGAARAFSRRLYENLNFPESVGEDIYSYLYCRFNNMEYAFVDKISVAIKLPSNMADYWRQSIRFVQSRKRYYAQFGKKFVKKELRLPMIILVKAAGIYFFRFPFSLLLYLALYFSSRLNSAFFQKVNDCWEISNTAKINLPDNTPCQAEKIDWKIKGRRFLYGLARQFDRLGLEPEPLILIYCYHGIGEDNWRYSISLDMFKRQIEHLKNNYQPIGLSDIADHLSGQKIITRPSFALTFDDGYRDVLNTVDICREYGIKPTMFIMSDPEQASRSELENYRPLLNDEEIKFLIRSGWEIGSHSATHADFSRLTEINFEQEIPASKNRIEKNINQPVRYFSYPRGSYNPAIRAAVKRSGYELAVTMDDTYITNKIDPWALPRIGVDGTHSLTEFLSLHRYPAVLTRKLLRRFF